MRRSLINLLLAATLAWSSLSSVASTVGDSAADQEQAAKARMNSAIVGLVNSELEPFVDILDIEQLLERVFEESAPRMSSRERLRKEFIDKEAVLVSSLATSFSEADSVTHLRTRSTVGVVEVLYRIEFADGGFSYMEFMVNPSSLSIFDWYDYSIGRNASETFREVVVSMLGPQSFSELITSTFDGSKESRARLVELTELISSREYTKAIRLYVDSPKQFKSQPTALNLLIQAGTNSSVEEDYEIALSQIAEYAGDDPRYSFVLLDYYVLQGNFEKSIEVANRLQQRMGLVESVLEESKAAIYLMQDDLDEAIVLVENAVVLEPDRDATQAWLFELYAMDERYADAHRVFMLLNEQFGYGLTLDDFADDADLQPFVEWAREHNQAVH